MDEYFFVLYLLDENGEVLENFEPKPGQQNAGVFCIDDGPIGMARVMMGALLEGVSMTVVSVDFEWGTAVIHLPQAWEGETNPATIALVVSLSESALKEAAGFEPTGALADDPTGDHAVDGPHDTGAIIDWHRNNSFAYRDYPGNPDDN